MLKKNFNNNNYAIKITLKYSHIIDREGTQYSV